MFGQFQSLPASEDDYTTRERLYVMRKRRSAEEQKRLDSDERVSQKHNKASREMVLYNREVGNEMKQKLAEYKLKYVRVSMPFVSLTCRLLIWNAVC